MTPPKKEKIVEKMANKSQKVTKKTVENPPASPAMNKGVFETLKKKFEPGKVDEFQKKWLALPENRKKYQKISDAPQVAAEEIIAITNDLIDYLQGESTGKSGLLKKLKSTVGNFFKNPAKFVQEKVDAGKEVVVDVKNKTQEKAEEMVTTMKSKAQKKSAPALPKKFPSKTSSKATDSKVKKTKGPVKK